MAIGTCLPFVVIQIAAAETFKIYMSSYYEGRSAIAPTHAASVQSSISFASDPNSTMGKGFELKTLKDLARRTDNSLIQALTNDNHYIFVNPQPVSSPRLVLYSPDAGNLIGLLEEESATPHFTQVFAGNVRFGTNDCWATYYGRHMNGKWYGHLGDGRAMSIGEVSHNGKRLEIQLKGSGKTAYSYGELGGRASIAEGIREFLTSEAMFRLGVPTTRALSLVEHDSGREDGQGNDKCAVLSRIAPSFLRPGHLDVHWKEGEMERLRVIVEHAISREFPDLAAPKRSDESPRTVHYYAQASLRFAELFKRIAIKLADLVTQWLRVGFMHNNLTTDNLTLGGYTIDYDRCEFFSIQGHWHNDRARDFLNQHKPVFANLEILGKCFLRLNLHMCKCWIDSSSSMEPIPGEFEQAKQEITAVLRTGFRDARIASLEREIPRKLGLRGSRRAVALWYDATVLCYETSVDYTTFFRCLSCIQMKDGPVELAASKSEITKKASGKKELNVSQANATEGQARVKLNDTAQANTSSTDVQKREEAVRQALSRCFGGCGDPPSISWYEWFARYDEAKKFDGRTAEIRRREMDAANPKYVLRRSMLQLAAVYAMKGNYGPAKEIMEVLRRPYDEQSDAVEKRWCSYH